MACARRADGASKGAHIPSIIDAVYYWCSGTKGDWPLDRALQRLSEGLGADAIAISRIRKGNAGQPRLIVYDSRFPAEAPRRLRRSFAEFLLGDYLSTARPGTAWFQSVVGDAPDPELETFQRSRGLREFAVIPLSVSEKATDLLELHFSNSPSAEQHAYSNMLAGTLAEAWNVRSKGVFTQHCLAPTAPRKGGLDAASVLCAENPAGLSRSEYRVCLLLSSGIAPSDLCGELTISRSTLRSHLRNIYAKTGTVNMQDLLYLLLKPPVAGASRLVA